MNSMQIILKKDTQQEVGKKHLLIKVDFFFRRTHIPFKKIGQKNG